MGPQRNMTIWPSALAFNMSADRGADKDIPVNDGTLNSRVYCAHSFTPYFKGPWEMSACVVRISACFDAFLKRPLERVNHAAL